MIEIPIRYCRICIYMITSFRCGICYQEINNDIIHCTNCEATYHDTHLAAWLLNNDTCCQCRSVMTEELIQNLAPKNNSQLSSLKQIKDDIMGYFPKAGMTLKNPDSSISKQKSKTSNFTGQYISRYNLWKIYVYLSMLYVLIAFFVINSNTLSPEIARELFIILPLIIGFFFLVSEILYLMKSSKRNLETFSKSLLIIFVYIIVTLIMLY